MKPSTLTILLLISGLFFFQKTVQAQNNDSTELANLSAELDALFANEQDSLSLLSLIDSLLTIPSAKSQLSIRLGYSSRVTTAGRDFGVDQQGLSPGISYYHKSGLYGDVTGVWNSELDPKYYLSIGTIGYLGTLGKKWSYSASYDHSFYHSSDTTDVFPLTNSLSASVSHDFKYAYTGLNYSYSFGDETAHQLTWNITGVIRKKGFGPFTSISLLPTFSILWGNQTITTQYFNVDRFEQVRNLEDADINRISRNRDLTEAQARRLRAIRSLANSDRLTPEQRSFLENTFTEFETSNTFGLMNYYISLPINLTTKKLSLRISYNYNIPRELSDSIYESEGANGYFGFTLSYNIGL